MARLVFLQLNYYELYGPQAITAVLAEAGHQCELVVPGLEKDPLGAIIRLRPAVVGIGHNTVERAEALLWARAIKEATGAKVVLGGIDPTFTPELALEPSVDAVVLGEAEETMRELMERVAAGADFSDLAGVAVARDGQLHLNPRRPLITDLDSLPFPAKELYFRRYRRYREYPIKSFLASRGCPHACTYCANRGLRELYPNPEAYVRFKSPEYLLAEIKAVLSAYPARTVGFGDDLFTFRQSWLEKFLPLYRREIGLPFFCTARIDAMTEEKARLLKEAGCYTVWYGLETARAETRRNVLGRPMSDEAIRQGTEILHRHGIITQTYNMLNIPGQTWEEGLETLAFNRDLKNEFVVASLFQPFPGTRLAQQLLEEGALREPEKLASRESISYFAFSPFRQPDTDRLINLQKFFILSHWFPRLVPLIKKLCTLPPNPLFDILFLGTFAVDYARVHRLTWGEVVRYNLDHLWTTYLRKNWSRPEVPGQRR